MFNPFLAILHNTKLDRYHPILFDERPLPGPPSPDKPIRHKSVGHHPDGFTTREEAIKHVEEKVIAMREAGEPELKLATLADLVWDGEGIPAMVAFFVQDGEGWRDGMSAITSISVE